MKSRFSKTHRDASLMSFVEDDLSTTTPAALKEAEFLLLLEEN